MLSGKRQLEIGVGRDGDGHENPDAKRRRILEETRDIDADSDASGSDTSDGDRFGQWIELCYKSWS